MLARLVAGLSVAATPVALRAVEPAPPGDVERGSAPATSAEPPAGPARGVGFFFASDFTSAYFFRGILQERDGFIWQPYGGVTLTVATDLAGGIIDEVAVSLASFNSIQSADTGAVHSPRSWYESDVIAGVTVGVLDCASTNLSYVAYVFPNGAYPTGQELDWTTQLDDSAWLGAFALHPAMLWAFELDNTAFGEQKGVYLQLETKPGVTLFESADYPLTLALPLSVGLSVSDYYDVPGGANDTFGYFDAGLVASLPLSFVPAAYGAWSVNASVDVLALSDTLADVNRGDSAFVVGKGGIAFAY
ncbi:MAG: hypothetical protein SF182_23170 [Deltaproteobacteria bacterium]|nr:hypothetical protein [Deltaproteobacteria bacterium]